MPKARMGWMVIESDRDKTPSERWLMCTVGESESAMFPRDSDEISLYLSAF